MWKDLSIREKSEVIKMAVAQGMIDVDEIKQFYDSTLNQEQPQNNQQIQSQEELEQQQLQQRQQEIDAENQYYLNESIKRSGNRNLVYVPYRDINSGELKLKPQNIAKYKQQVFDDSQMSYDNIQQPPTYAYGGGLQSAFSHRPIPEVRYDNGGNLPTITVKPKRTFAGGGVIR